MKGRYENKIKIENNIEHILNDMPKIVTDFYYNISVRVDYGTCQTYIRHIRSFLEFCLKYKSEIDFTCIDDSDIGRFLNSKKDIVDSYGNVHEASMSYQKNIHTALNLFFEYLKNKNIIDFNPVKIIARPVGKDKVDRIYLDAEQISKLINSTYNLNSNSVWAARDKAIIVLFAETGIRRTALSEIDIDSFDFDNNSLTVLDKRRKYHNFVLSDNCIDIIKVWLEFRNDIMKNDSGAFFISNQKRRLTDKSVYNIIQKYSEKALGFKISPHKLRASLCRLLYQKTSDIKFVSEFIGHDSMLTTKLYVGDDGIETKKKGMDIISNTIRYK